MRTAFIKELIKSAEENDKIQLITGDLGYGVLNEFWERYPKQYINAGIAEQSMTSIAAGMALAGNIVFTYSIGNFPTMRCLEQIRNDCAYNNANVKIVALGGGFAYGPHGMSHHATEDIAIMRSLPNVVVTAPADPIEAMHLTKELIKTPGTCYMRLGRGGEKTIHEGEINDFKIGKAIKLKDGDRISIFSTGTILEEAVDLQRKLSEEGIESALYSFHTIKPIDKEVIIKCANKSELIVTMEEHNVIGGLGSAVAETMTETKNNCRLFRAGLNDIYSDVVGNQKYLRKVYGIDSDSVKEKIMKIIKKEEI